MMTHHVEFIRPDATIEEAAKMMKDHNIGSLPVCDGDRLVGMVTDRDLVIRAVSDRKNLQKTHVKEVMSTPIVYCFDDQEAEEAARIMEVKKIRRVVVLDRAKRMVGIATLDNLAETQALAGEVIANLTHSIHEEVA